MRSSNPFTARMSLFHAEALCPFQLARAGLTTSSSAPSTGPAVSLRLRREPGMPCALSQPASKQRPLAGMLLVTPYDSIEAVAKEQYFWVPVGLLLRDRFASIEHVRANRTPVAVIAAEGDRVVRPQRTAALRAQISNLAFDRTLPGASHATIDHLPAYGGTFREAFAALERATPRLPVAAR